MLRKPVGLVWIAFFLIIIVIGGCAEKQEKLFVYSGKSLKKPMEDIRVAFEQKYHIKPEIIYAGSITCLNTIRQTEKGDVFIPGSVTILKAAGVFVDNHKYVALHVPVIGVHKDNPKNIHTLNDLAIPGVKIAIGNEKMCSIGDVVDTILGKSNLEDQLTQNVVIKTSTCVEIADLLLQKEVQAGILWQDLLNLPKYQDLRHIEIPHALNAIQEIHVAVLTISQNKNSAQLFADFVASEGKTIFKKHGFGEK
jgi:molybdate transport system substrate-binding protein